MNDSLLDRGLAVLEEDGPVVFTSKVKHFLENRIAGIVDPIFKSHHVIGVVFTPIVGLLHGRLIFKTRNYYVRYTLRNNIFGKRAYYFPDFKHGRSTHKARTCNEAKYFTHDRIFIEPNDRVFEVGAAKGITTQIAAERAKHVIALEPSPRTFRCLRKNIIAENVDVYPYAAWKDSGEKEIQYATQSGSDSLIEPNSGRAVTSRSVRVDTIENLINELEIDTVDFLKVEAEGAEPEVVEGIGDLKISKLVVNCSEERYGESPFEEVSEKLREMGYEIVDFDGVCLYATG